MLQHPALPLPNVLLASLVVASLLVLFFLRTKRSEYDLDKIPGPWKHAKPVVGNILEALTPDFHRCAEFHHTRAARTGVVSHLYFFMSKTIGVVVVGVRNLFTYR